MIDLYTSPTPNGFKISIALEELGLPYTVHAIDLGAKDQKKPEFLAMNPNGRIPVIVDRDAGDFPVFESGAILLYLARKSGKLIPGDLAGEAQVLRWSFAALTSIEVPVLARWFVDLNDGKGTKPSEALSQWAQLRLGQLDGWLADRRFLATDDFTVADILMTHVLDAGTDDALLQPHANLLAYRARCTERPAWKRTLAAYLERVKAA